VNENFIKGAFSLLGNGLPPLIIDTNKVVNGGYSVLSGNSKLANFSKKYELVEHQLKQVLNEFGYKRLDPTKLNQPLPFTAEILTLYRDQGEYRIVDAIFYWEDKYRRALFQ